MGWCGCEDFPIHVFGVRALLANTEENRRTHIINRVITGGHHHFDGIQIDAIGVRAYFLGERRRPSMKTVASIVRREGASEGGHQSGEILQLKERGVALELHNVREKGGEGRERRAKGDFGGEEEDYLLMSWTNQRRAFFYRFLMSWTNQRGRGT